MPEHLDDIARSVKAGKCILFLGAGMHYPPPEPSPSDAGPPRWQYPENQRPPLGAELAKELAKKCDLLEKYKKEASNIGNLARVAQFFEKEKGRDALVDEIIAAVHRGDFKGIVRQTKPSPAVCALAEMPFPLIITTNYDHLFERALQMADRGYQLGVYDPEGAVPTKDLRDDPDPERPFLYKLHGDIDERKSIVITDEDYIRFILRMTDHERYHPVPGTFRDRFKKWPTLFIGYSLLDYNMRLLFRTLRWKLDKADWGRAFSVSRSPDPLIAHFWGSGPEQSVWFIVQDLWVFIPELYKAVMGKEMP